MDSGVSELVSRDPGDVQAVEAGALVVSHVCQCVEINGMRIPPSWKGIIGSQGRALFQDGFDVDMIVGAAIIAVRRGRPELLQYVAGDLMLAGSGQAMSERDYQVKLKLYETDKSARPSLLEEQQQRLAARRSEIDEMRRGRS